MGNGDDFARSIGIPLNDIDGAVSILKEGVITTLGELELRVKSSGISRNTFTKHYPVTGEPSREESGSLELS